MNRKESWDTIRKATNSAESMGAHSTDQVIQNHLFQANQRVRALEEENNKLKSSLASRELELSRAGMLIGDAAISNNSLSPNYYDSIANSTQVTEAANKRIIDQLNGQVDFLNDQLAQREAQLATVTKRWSTVESLESELDLKTSMVDNLKEENSHLVTRSSEELVSRSIPHFILNDKSKIFSASSQHCRRADHMS
jgi:predicted RNase H-like nuclease (RuvC/YqgF family)